MGVANLVSYCKRQGVYFTTKRKTDLLTGMMWCCHEDSYHENDRIVIIKSQEKNREYVHFLVVFIVKNA